MRRCPDMKLANIGYGYDSDPEYAELTNSLRKDYMTVYQILSFLPDTTRLDFALKRGGLPAEKTLIVTFDPCEKRIAELEYEIERALSIKLRRSREYGERYKATATWNDLVFVVRIASCSLDEWEGLEQAFAESGSVRRLPDQPCEKSWWPDTPPVYSTTSPGFDFPGDES